MPKDEEYRDARQNSLLAITFFAVHLCLFFGIIALFGKAYTFALISLAIAFILFFAARAVNLRWIRKDGAHSRKEIETRPPTPADNDSEVAPEDDEEWD